MKKLFFSIIIPSFNNKDLTLKCIESIRKNTQGITYEIIVVDDCSTDGAREMLEKQKDIHLVLNKNNQGFAKNNNQAAKIAKGEYLIFLNNDTEVQKCWLEAIEDVFKSEKNVGAVGVKLTYPNNKVQHAGVMIQVDHTPKHIYQHKPSDYRPANHQRDFKILTAACLVIPKKIFEKFGGFDEEFRNGFEDVDLCLKIFHGGYRLIYTPKAVVVHHESVAPGRFRAEDKNFELMMSRWKNEESDSHKFYREDGFSWPWILWQDLYTMSWGKDRFGTRPKWIKFARIIFIPTYKFFTFLKLLFKGDFSEIKNRSERYR